jgi:hypothetical protein
LKPRKRFLAPIPLLVTVCALAAVLCQPAEAGGLTLRIGTGVTSLHSVNDEAEYSGTNVLPTFNWGVGWRFNKRWSLELDTQLRWHYEGIEHVSWLVTPTVLYTALSDRYTLRPFFRAGLGYGQIRHGFESTRSANMACWNFGMGLTNIMKESMRWSIELRSWISGPQQDFSYALALYLGFEFDIL